MTVSTVICRECGNQFTFTNGIGKSRSYCSADCRKSAKSRCVRAWRKRKKFGPDKCEGCGGVQGKTFRGLCKECSLAQRKIARAFDMRRFHGRVGLPPVIRDTPRQHSYTCAECGEHHSVRPHTGRQLSDYKYCSGTCRKRASDRIRTRLRRAATRGAGVEAVDYNVVFDRDGWRCGLCGAKTLKSKRGSQHPKAPVVDHIVPLSKGGGHTYRNVQCACHACNSAKGADEIGRLRLF